MATAARLLSAFSEEELLTVFESDENDDGDAPHYAWDPGADEVVSVADSQPSSHPSMPEPAEVGAILTETQEALSNFETSLQSNTKHGSHKRALTQEARFNEELINERRNQLQKFLQELIANPEIISGTIPPSLTAFLAYESVEAFEDAKKELEQLRQDLGDASATDDDLEEAIEKAGSALMSYREQ